MKQITIAEVLAAIGFSLIVYGVGRMHLESALILSGVCAIALGLLVAARKP